MKKETLSEIKAGIFVFILFMVIGTAFITTILTAGAIFEHYIEDAIYKEINCK